MVLGELPLRGALFSALGSLLGGGLSQHLLSGGTAKLSVDLAFLCLHLPKV